jgi:hypothetical protein
MISKKNLSAALTVTTIFLGLVARIQAAPAYQGYIFCASGQTAYLLNPSGTKVHEWKATSSARSCAYLLPDGSALFPIQTSCTVRGDGAYPHGRLQKVSWEGKVIWDAVVCDETFTPGYDLEPLPNGNVLVAGASSSGGLKIVEIQQSGTSGKTVAWQYNLPDSLGNTGYINSISYNPDLKYIGIDINQAKKLVVIDYTTKSIVCTYRVSSGTATHAAMWVTKYYIGTDIVMADADLTAMRVNNLLVVNNSLQVVEFNPATRSLVKTLPFSFSAHEGSVQRLPNGNTLVNSANNKVTELSENGSSVSTVRTITLPGSAARAYMYGPAYPGLRSTSSLEPLSTRTTRTGNFIYHTASNTGRITLAKGSEWHIRIYSLSGKTVYSRTIQEDKAVFSTGDLLSGVYYITFGNASASFKDSFVKM